jgi:uncharacterized protein (DUF1800 family)
LNRLGFGPRPGDVERVLASGVSAYIDRQLKPEEIPDTASTANLKRFPTLAMTTAELFDRFERPLREAQREKRRELANPGTAMSDGKAAESAADEAELVRRKIPPENRPRRVIEELSQARILRACESERQLNEVPVDFWMNHFTVFAAKGLDRVFPPPSRAHAVRASGEIRRPRPPRDSEVSGHALLPDNAQSADGRPIAPSGHSRRAAFGRGLFGMREGQAKSEPAPGRIE